jgi:hypothetical protein
MKKWKDKAFAAGANRSVIEKNYKGIVLMPLFASVLIMYLRWQAASPRSLHMSASPHWHAINLLTCESLTDRLVIKDYNFGISEIN